MSGGPEGMRREPSRRVICKAVLLLLFEAEQVVPEGLAEEVREVGLRYTPCVVYVVGWPGLYEHGAAAVAAHVALEEAARWLLRHEEHVIRTSDVFIEDSPFHIKPLLGNTMILQPTATSSVKRAIRTA